MVKKIIGKGGCHTKGISERTECKIRVRGRGSRHLEGDGKEAPVPLMVAVTADKTDPTGFALAMQLTLRHLKVIEDEFIGFVQNRGLPTPTQRLFSIGEISDGAQQLFASALRDSARKLPLHPSDEGYGTGYNSLAACLCSSPWATWAVKNRVRMAALGLPLRQLTGEDSG